MVTEVMNYSKSDKRHYFTFQYSVHLDTDLRRRKTAEFVWQENTPIKEADIALNARLARMVMLKVPLSVTSVQRTQQLLRTAVLLALHAGTLHTAQSTVHKHQQQHQQQYQQQTQQYAIQQPILQLKQCAVQALV